MHLCVCLLPFFVQACQHFNLWPLGVALCLQSSFYRLHGTSGGNDTVHSMSFCSTKSSFLLFKCPSLLPYLSISYIVKSSHEIKGRARSQMETNPHCQKCPGSIMGTQERRPQNAIFAISHYHIKRRAWVHRKSASPKNTRRHKLPHKQQTHKCTQKTYRQTQK